MQNLYVLKRDHFPPLNENQVINVFIITLHPFLIRNDMVDNSAIKVNSWVAVRFEDECFPKIKMNFIICDKQYSANQVK